MVTTAAASWRSAHIPATPNAPATSSGSYPILTPTPPPTAPTPFSASASLSGFEPVDPCRALQLIKQARQQKARDFTSQCQANADAPASPMMPPPHTTAGASANALKNDSSNGHSGSSLNGGIDAERRDESKNLQAKEDDEAAARPLRDTTQETFELPLPSPFLSATAAAGTPAWQRFPFLYGQTFTASRMLSAPRDAQRDTAHPSARAVHVDGPAQEIASTPTPSSPTTLAPSTSCGGMPLPFGNAEPLDPCHVLELIRMSKRRISNSMNAHQTQPQIYANSQNCTSDDFSPNSCPSTDVMLQQDAASVSPAIPTSPSSAATATPRIAGTQPEGPRPSTTPPTPPMASDVFAGAVVGVEQPRDQTTSASRSGSTSDVVLGGIDAECLPQEVPNRQAEANQQQPQPHADAPSAGQRTSNDERGSVQRSGLPSSSPSSLNDSTSSTSTRLPPLPLSSVSLSLPPSNVQQTLSAAPTTTPSTCVPSRRTPPFSPPMGPSPKGSPGGGFGLVRGGSLDGLGLRGESGGCVGGGAGFGAVGANNNNNHNHNKVFSPSYLDGRFPVVNRHAHLHGGSCGAAVAAAFKCPMPPSAVMP